LTFGLPLPVGLELIERDEDVARFRSPYSHAALVDFYDRALPQHRRGEAPDGTFYERTGEGATGVYLVEGAEGLEVLYVQGPADLEALGLSTGALAGEAPAPARRRSAVVAPPEVVRRLRAQRAAGPPDAQGGGAYYDERFEDVEGEPVRVLTLRDQPSDTLLDGQGQPLEPWDGRSASLPRRPGGSYDRGQNQRSLRPTPELDAEGNPLPFGGTQRVVTNPNAHPH
jgi:hypothetical protein